MAYKPLSQPGMLLDPANPINRGLVGWWPINEGAGRRLLDISRFGRFTTTVNAPLFAGGVNGVGLNLVSANSQFTQLSDTNNSFAFANTTFSVSFWIKTSTVNTNNIIVGKHTGGTNTGWYFNLIPGTGMQCALRGASVITRASASPSTTYIDNKWHHVVGVFTTDTVGSANNIVIYLDGRDDTGTLSSPNAYLAPDSSIPLRIGSREGTGALYYDGAIADLRIFNRGINSLEVKQLYTQPSIGLYYPNAGRYFVAAGGVTGTGAVTLADFTGAGVGSTTVIGSSAVTLASFTGTGSGAVGNDVTGTGAVTLANFTGTGSGTTTIVGSGAITITGFTGAGLGTTTIVGTSATIFTDFVGAGTGAAGTTTGSGAITLDGFLGAGTGNGSTSISPSGGYYYQAKSYRQIAEEIELAQYETLEAEREAQRLEDEKLKLLAKKNAKSKKIQAALSTKELELQALIDQQIQIKARLMAYIAMLRIRQNNLLIMMMACPLTPIKLTRGGQPAQL